MSTKNTAMVIKSDKISAKYLKLHKIDPRLVRLHQCFDVAGVPKRGRNQIVATKTDYSLSMVARVLTGNVPLTMRFINAVCNAFKFEKDRIEPGELLSDQSQPINDPVLSSESEHAELFIKSVVVNEALKELRLMSEPKRWEAVAMLKRMNSEEQAE